MSSRSTSRCPLVGRAALVVLAVVATQALVVPVAEAAAPLVTNLTSEGFTGSTTADSGWYRPSSGTNSACLTAGTSTSQRPIPGCSSSAIDSSGSGALRLTSNVLNTVGTVYNTTSLPTSQGLDVRFTAYQWNSHTTPGADGINFILAATDPTNPAPPAATGPSGGSLGYSTSKSTPGVTNGYLGFGLDVFGNYRNSSYGGSDCSASTTAAQNVTVRGPGNGTAGYCIAGTRQVSGTLDSRTATSRPAGVPVEVALNPASTATTSLGGVSVPATSWLIAYTPLGGAQQTLTGTLPTAAQLAGYGYPASYYDAASGLPYQLTFGWAASTGGNDEIHEINTLASSTLNGQLPDFNLALDDDQAGALLAGSTANVAVTPSLDATQGPESRPATVTTTFPTGMTPSNPTTPGYACSTSGRVVSCTYTPTSAVQPGQSLPILSIPVLVSSTSATGKTITAKVSSTDANPAQATRTVSFVAFAAQATPDHVTYGTPATLSTSGLPADASGTITFSSAGAALCTATLPNTSCGTAANLAPASYAVSAAYSGDAKYPTKTAGTSLVVDRATPDLSAGVSGDQVPYGSPEVLSVSGLPAEATGTVTFTSGGRTLCTVPDVTTSTSCTAASDLEVGDYPVTASYGGDAKFGPRTATTTFGVVKVEVDLQASVAQDPVRYGTPETLSVSGLPTGATGTVRFTDDDGDVLCTIDDVATSTSCQADAGLDTGTYTVTAAYSGDAHHQKDTASTSFSVTKADTDLVAGVSDSSVPFGTSSTLSFSGLPTGATGTVTFRAGNRTLCRVDVEKANGCSSPADLPRGTYTVAAAYSGDSHLNGSDDSVGLTVLASGSPRFTASVSDPAPTYGTPTTLSFSGLAAQATGTVTFQADGKTLCRVDVEETSSCATPGDLVVDRYDVTARYSGDDNFDPAQTTTSFRVGKVATTLTAAVVQDPIGYGAAQTLSFAGLPTGATGSLTFTDAAGDVLCTVPDVTASAGCSTRADLDAGDYAVGATYAGDDNHEGSTGSVTFAVEKAATTLRVGVGADPVPYGIGETLSFGPLPSGAGGSVVFATEDGPLCTVEDVTAAASCVAPAGLPAGAYTVTATYSGDHNHAGTSQVFTFVVAKAATSVQASVGRPAVPYGTAETLVFGNLPSSATGSVTFTRGQDTVCTVADVRLATSCTTGDALETGAYPLVATYSGDDDHAGSQDETSFTVVRAASSLAAAVRTANVPFGTAESISVSVLPGPARGKVTFSSGGRTLCTIADVAQTTSCDTSDQLPAGPYPVVAAYSGDDRYAPATTSTGFSVVPSETDLVVGVRAPQVEHGQREVLVVEDLPDGATGTVTFISGERTLCTVDLASSTSCEAPPDLPVGTYPVQAVYSGDADHQSDEAATEFEVVRSTVEGFAATVDPARTPYGTPTTLSFSGLPVGATGAVEFVATQAVPPRVEQAARSVERTTADVFCTVTDVTVADSCTTPASLEPGDYRATAVYSGDDDVQPAQAEVAFTVYAALTDVTGGAEGDPVTGAPVTLTVGSLPDDATGTVVLSTGGTTLCTITLPARSCTVTGLAAGTYTVETAYSGDARYDPSTSTFELQVAAANAGGSGSGSGGSSGGGGSGDNSSGSGNSSGGGTLASTGGPGIGVAAGGLLLLLSGLGSLLVARRRRQRTRDTAQNRA